MRIMHYVHFVLSAGFLSVIKCIIRYPVIVFMGLLKFIYELFYNRNKQQITQPVYIVSLTIFVSKSFTIYLIFFASIA